MSAVDNAVHVEIRNFHVGMGRLQLESKSKLKKWT